VDVNILPAEMSCLLKRKSLAKVETVVQKIFSGWENFCGGSTAINPLYRRRRNPHNEAERIRSSIG
jgi:hypothetical protein